MLIYVDRWSVLDLISCCEEQHVHFVNFAYDIHAVSVVIVGGVRKIFHNFHF